MFSVYAEKVCGKTARKPEKCGPERKFLRMDTFKFQNEAKKEEKANSREDTYCKTCSDEFVYNNRQVEYNENSAEENFIRDRQRRLRQLDDFLKNGIIDKEEYMVLRSHYDR